MTTETDHGVGEAVAARIERRWATLSIVIVGLLIVKFVNPRDTGDQYIAILATVAIYFTSFFVIKNSAFFRQTPVNEPARTKTSSPPSPPPPASPISSTR